jgi:hypothetical protein
MSNETHLLKYIVALQSRRTDRDTAVVVIERRMDSQFKHVYSMHLT